MKVMYIYINVFNAIDVTSYLFEKIIYEIIYDGKITSLERNIVTRIFRTINILGNLITIFPKIESIKRISNVIIVRSISSTG